jgi:hypothetical protein
MLLTVMELEDGIKKLPYKGAWILMARKRLIPGLL